VAVERRYPEQMPFVGTQTMKDRLEEESNDRRTSIAKIIRDMIDERYLLNDGEEVGLEEQVQIAQRALDRAEHRLATARRRVDPGPA